MSLNNEFVEYCKEGNIEKIRSILNDSIVDTYRELENLTKECKVLIERFIKLRNSQS